MNRLPLSLDIAKEAYSDIAEIGYYFARKAPENEDRFYQALDETLHLLASAPELGERCQFHNPKTVGIRVWQVAGFSNYLVFYRSNDAVLQVLRVVHGVRDYPAIFEKENQ
jgi:plasmid stabilization system protein ParE